MHRTFAATGLIPGIAALAIIVTLGFSLAPATAAGSGNRWAAVASAHPAARRVHAGYGLRASLPGISSAAYPAFIYADTGLQANSIDEFGAKPAGLTFLGNVATGGRFAGADYSQNDIGIARANSIHGPCLVHADSGGLVESFSINPVTGLLSLVSSLPEGDGTNFLPGDVKLSQDDNVAFVAVSSVFNGTKLVSLKIGTACALAAGSTFRTPGAQYFDSIALVGNQLFTIDISAGVAYV
ncbi:MAG: hypothetical protein M3Z66_17445, partial [Chloroflexota bacterium]|nr:hypothetical protein [Chloroflexota bacterium]